jgi:hypothetical protein
VRIFLHHSSIPYSKPKPPFTLSASHEAGPQPVVTEADVQIAQEAWASAIKTISRTHREGGDYVQAAANAAADLYAYGQSNVLFKPTKAAEQPFRPTGEEALSYFVGGRAVANGYDEDTGFAINGGKGWSDVEFANHQIDLNGHVAIAMGIYYFTCATTGNKDKVEYTFGYKKGVGGSVRIFLHHSSLPYSKPKPVVNTPPKLGCATEGPTSSVTAPSGKEKATNVEAYPVVSDLEK